MEFDLAVILETWTVPRGHRYLTLVDVQDDRGHEMARTCRHIGESQYPSPPRLDAGVRRHDDPMKGASCNVIPVDDRQFMDPS
jgi:hypothetical protein